MSPRRNTSGVAYHPSIFAMHRTLELRAQLHEEEEKRRYKRLLAGAYWLQRATIAYWMIRDLVVGGEAWYDDDNNVPSYGPAKERAKIVEAQVKSQIEKLPKYKASLYKDVFIWTDEGGAFIFQRENKERWYPIAFANAQAAREFIDRLPYSNAYGGFVVGGQEVGVSEKVSQKGTLPQ